MITKEILVETIKQYRYKIDDDAKGIYIGELGLEWDEAQDIELADSILEELKPDWERVYECDDQNSLISVGGEIIIPSSFTGKKVLIQIREVRE